nr:alpha-tocopherol transfer protein-like [Leptinotarsa decemlineata]
MNSDRILVLQTDNQKVRDVFQKSKKDVMEYIETIKMWFKTQPHLPEVPSDQLIETFLVTNKFSVEETKKKLDMYYTIRSVMPECFRNKNPKLPHMQEISKNIYYCPLPKLTKDLFRTIITKIGGDPSKFDVYNLFAHQMNINEILIQEDLNLGDILIFDLEHLQMGHMLKFTPIHLKKADTILQKVFSNRIKAIHLLNYPPFIDKLMAILKAVLKQKLLDRVSTIHTMC